MKAKNELIFMVIGALSVATAILLSAYGVHGLEQIFLETPRKEKAWGNAVDYQMFHGLALFLLGFIRAKPGNSLLLSVSGWVMMTACILFCLSIYAWVLGGPISLIQVTPWGGVLFVVSWVLLAIYAWSNKLNLSKNMEENE